MPKEDLKIWEKGLVILFILILFMPQLISIDPGVLNIDTINLISALGILFGVITYFIGLFKEYSFNNRLRENLYKELESNFYVVHDNLRAILEIEKNPEKDHTLMQITNNTFWALVNTNKLTIFSEDAVVMLTGFYNGDQSMRHFFSSANEVTLTLLSKGVVATDLQILLMKKHNIKIVLNQMLKNLKDFLNIIGKDELLKKWEEKESKRHAGIKKTFEEWSKRL